MSSAIFIVGRRGRDKSGPYRGRRKRGPYRGRRKRGPYWNASMQNNELYPFIVSANQLGVIIQGREQCAINRVLTVVASGRHRVSRAIGCHALQYAEASRSAKSR